MLATSSMGMAKPRPSTEAEEELLPEEYLAETMPMTSPWLLNSGPPELPELMAQSVWIMFIWRPSLMVMERSRAEMMPVLSEKVSSPKGLPMVVTCSPTSISLDLPMTTGVRPVASTLITAMSFFSSPPT